MGYEPINFLWTHRTQDHPWLTDEELLVERGEGVWLWTMQGRKLLDGFAGLSVVNVGHGRREIVEAIAEQAARLAYYPTSRQFSNQPAADLAARLAALTPGDLHYTMYAVSGSEANERSMQIARHYWLACGRSKKYKVISLQGAYHGATIGTLAVCGLPGMVEAYRPLMVPGFAKARAPNPVRDGTNITDDELVARCAAELSEAIQREDPETVSAVILEPFLSAGGYVFPPQGWLRAVRRICDEHEVLMIADEVVTGFGRTGRWFACEHEGVVPDLMSLAKGITSGYVPLSASVARSHLAAAFTADSIEENVHPTTYAGHPLACAAALANLAVLESENMVANAATMGSRLVDRLLDAVGNRAIVADVRGRGLMACVELIEPDRSGRALPASTMSKLEHRIWQNGAIVYSKGSILRLAPPLCINAEEVDFLIKVVADSISELDQQLRH
jgi:putrescine---pyruvate transaminase